MKQQCSLEEAGLFMGEVFVPRFSQKSVEWYTPRKYVEAARQVMGSIDLDPASCQEANRTVGATVFFDKATDGLRHSWRARCVWLNPPYCKEGGVSNQGRWTSKLLAEYRAGHIEQAMVLVNAATETLWFQRLFAFPMCFVKGRIQFYGPAQRKGGSTLGSVFVYLGEQVDRFEAVFRQFGVVVRSALSPFAEGRLWQE